MADDVASDLTVTTRLVIPQAELQWRFSRSSGPGGQSVNTTDSRVQLGWDAGRSDVLSPAQRARLLEHVPDGVIWVVASEHRSQWQNRRAARQKLAALVRAVVLTRPRARRPTRPSRSAVERRLGAKHRRGDLKRQRRGTDD
ncbi:MAG: alternative ribosome rescue aminoacyl-tRNA hydrolase ArfB [Jiangellales bacterium]